MEHKEHHKREVFFLIGFLIIFFVIFIIALMDLKRGLPVFGIGLSYFTEDAIILVLSLLAMAKVVWHIIVY